MSVRRPRHPCKGTGWPLTASQLSGVYPPLALLPDSDSGPARPLPCGGLPDPALCVRSLPGALSQAGVSRAVAVLGTGGVALGGETRLLCVTVPPARAAVVAGGRLRSAEVTQCHSDLAEIPVPEWGLLCGFRWGHPGV